MVEFVRDINPDICIVMGGPYINSINLELDRTQQDYKYKAIGADVYVHDLCGEQTLYKVCLELRKTKPNLSIIPNLVYYESNKYHRTEKIPEVLNLDEDPVTELTFYEGHPVPAVYCRTAKSCPKKCAFCRYPLMGGEHIFMSVESVEKNLDYIYSLGVKYLTFVDDSFNIPLDRFKNILRLMIRKKYGFKWFSFFRESDSDEEAFDLMAESGCTAVLLGVESADITILKNMNKMTTVDHFRNTIMHLNSRGIMSLASCMVGFPGETEMTARKTIDFLNETQPTFFDLQTWFYERAVPINDEAEYYEMKSYGYGWSHKTMKWDRAADLVIDGIRNVKNSTYLPTLTFNLWPMAYFLSQGVKIDEVKRLSKIFVKMIGKDKHEIDDEYRKNEKEILSIFKGNKDLERNLMSRFKKDRKEIMLEKVKNTDFNF